ncbi:MAG: RtcB family protein [Phycisphaerae bacterium]
MSENSSLVPTGEATALLPAAPPSVSPITVIATAPIRATLDAATLQQALNTRACPGVTDVVLNPDAHVGYGAPIGCVLVSPTHIYPGPVGVDIKCSMSLLQLDLPANAVNDVRLRRDLIKAIGQRVPTGAGHGQRSVRKARHVNPATGAIVAAEGASPAVCAALGIPENWAQHCEDAAHLGHDGTSAALRARLEILRQGPFTSFADKITQLGSYGGGNHFGECEIVEVGPSPRAQQVAKVFGLKDQCVAFLSHCGSRGFGFQLADGQFRTLRQHFEAHGIPLPANDRHLVYAEIGTPEADAYLNDMALGGNFATINHLLINALVLEAFQEVIPGTTGQLVYFISHNIVRRELLDDKMVWVHRKGATRAFPANHPGLAGTPFAATGHPILLPGNPQAGSVVMVADPGARLSCYSVNHGAGRAKGRKAAIREFNQQAIDQSFTDRDILTNCRQYPKDEAPAAYKNFEEVLRSVTGAGLASEVARLRARFVIKDADKADD